MNKITQSEIETLTNAQGETVMSMYMPTNKISTPETRKEDQARYRNMLRQGFEKWEAKVDQESLKSIREQLEANIDDAEFWTNTYKAIGIFATKDSYTCLALPIECDEHICISDSFDLGPARVALSKEQPFYLLVLAKHDPKLLYGDSYTLEEVELDLPKSPEDALNIDEMFSGSNTIRGVSTQGGGNDMLSSHGQGDSNHAGQEEHLKYLRIIDNKILTTKDINRNLPLLVAATENEASDFMGVSNHPQLIKKYVPGNHTVTPLHELHELAWNVITEEVVDEKLSSLVTRFHEDKGRQKASSDLTQIAEAVGLGRVDTLLLGIVEKTNDSVSDANGSATPHIRLQNEYASNHMCHVIKDVVAQGGAIVGVEADKLETPTMVGALYRY